MYGMIGWFAKNEVAANLLMGVIIFLGLWSLAERIPLEVFPEFERDVISVTVPYRGATPAEVEQATVIRVEEAISDLDGIERVISNAFEGAGRVVVEVVHGRARELLDDIKNRVDAIDTFPNEVERPIYSVAQRRRQVISVVVSAALPEMELRALGDQTRDDLLSLPYITYVELTGVRPYEVSIEVSELTLSRYNLTFDHVVNAVRRKSIDLPAGSLKTSGGEILLRTTGQAYSAEDFSNVSLLSGADGAQVTLGEIATIKDGFDEEPLYAKFNGKSAIFIDVYRSGDQSAIKLGQVVRDYIEKKRESFPDGVTIDYWRDGSRIVKLRLQTLLKSAWQGGLLVFLLLTLFLRMSVAIWVCVGVPISFMGAIALMPELGVTINIISLFAFILVLGIVVDDAIITGENIYRRMENSSSSLDAAVTGAREVAVPVTFGLLTTVVAFAPLLFVAGDRGQIFAQIPLIVIPVLIFSWVESKLILPAHMRHVKYRQKKNAGKLKKFQMSVANGLEDAVERYYQPLLHKAIEQRYLTVALFVGFSFIILSFVISGRYNFTFFPRVQSETARATLSMQVGTSEAVTRRHVERMAKVAEDLKVKYTDLGTGESVVKNILMGVGWSSGHTGRSSGGSSELGQVSIELIPPEERNLTVTTSAIVNEWRKNIGKIPGAKELNFRAEIGRAGAPIDVQLTGQDFEQLRKVANEIKSRLSEYPGLFDIEDSFDQGKSEIKLNIRPEAELLGLSTEELGRQVRNAFFGAQAQRIQRGRDDVRVMIRYPKEERSSLASLESMRIRTVDGKETPIGNVTDISLGYGFSSIKRVDRQRAVNVVADVNKQEVNVNVVAKDIASFLDELLKQYPGVRYSFEGELKEQEKSLGSLMYGVVIVIFCIYTLLAVPLRSYTQPFVIMLAIPFSLVGAFLGHMLLDMNLSLMSVMGMLALAGVVVNDSLVLVDWINKRRDEGMNVGEAIRVAGMVRFRPILLTSLTTFAGLAPLIAEKSTQAQFLIPMAVSLGFGILYATLLSLLLVPVGYQILEDFKAAVAGATAG